MQRQQCVTYVFGLTSTARIMSFARRKKTHALGQMPVLDAMAGRVYSASFRTCCRPVGSAIHAAEVVCDKRDGSSKIIIAIAKSSFHMLGGCIGPNLEQRRSRRKCYAHDVGI